MGKIKTFEIKKREHVCKLCGECFMDDNMRDAYDKLNAHLYDNHNIIAGQTLYKYAQVFEIIEELTVEIIKTSMKLISRKIKSRKRVW